MACIAYTPLGKCIVILLVVYYTMIDIVYGLLVCALFIGYFQYVCSQTENVESRNEKYISPEITFSHKSGDFSIVKEQIKAQESLKPKLSDDFSMDPFLEKLGKFVPSLRVKSEPFATIAEVY